MAARTYPSQEVRSSSAEPVLSNYSQAENMSSSRRFPTCRNLFQRAPLHSQPYRTPKLQS
ncbi:hypothetical protein HYPGJ_31937 [Hyphomicrobium sp. GJ21]|nr:hypothetical protein HYPGJ_31937 [Hyphomicrobium sp. GJ21]